MYEKVIRRPGSTPKYQTKGPNLFSILEDVCQCFNSTTSDVIIKSSRDRDLVKIKRIYCYVSSVLTDAPLKNIAALLGYDHSSVVVHRDNCIDWLNINEPLFLSEWNVYLTNSKMWGRIQISEEERRSNGWTEEEWLKRITEKIKYSLTDSYHGWQFQLDTGRPTKTVLYNLRKLVKKGLLIGVRHKTGVEYFLPQQTTNTI